MQWDQSKLDLVKKRQKFVPVPRRVDTVTKFDHFNHFARNLRLKVFSMAEQTVRGPDKWREKMNMGINEHFFSYTS